MIYVTAGHISSLIIKDFEKYVTRYLFYQLYQILDMRWTRVKPDISTLQKPQQLLHIRLAQSTTDMIPVKYILKSGDQIRF